VDRGRPPLPRTRSLPAAPVLGVLDCDARRRLHWRFADAWWSVTLMVPHMVHLQDVFKLHTLVLGDLGALLLACFGFDLRFALVAFDLVSDSIWCEGVGVGVGARRGSTWAGGDYLRGALGWERRAILRTTHKARSHTHTQAQATQPLHRGPPTPIPTAIEQQRGDDGATTAQRGGDGATTAQRGDDCATARRREADQDMGDDLCVREEGRPRGVSGGPAARVGPVAVTSRQHPRNWPGRGPWTEARWLPARPMQVIALHQRPAYLCGHGARWGTARLLRIPKWTGHVGGRLFFAADDVCTFFGSAHHRVHSWQPRIERTSTQTPVGVGGKKGPEED